jgi:hypothetical protein
MSQRRNSWERATLSPRRTEHPQRVKGKFRLVAATFQLWKRSRLQVPSASHVVDNAREPNQGYRERPAVREMRLQDALFLHRTGQTGLRASRL